MFDEFLNVLFPELHGKWGYVNLNELLVFHTESIANYAVNPLLDPEFCADWVCNIHKIYKVDYSYGGWLENRADLWAGHYHKSGHTVHLGMDFNVPVGTKVHLPIKAILLHSEMDEDQNGGWGGKLIFKAFDKDFYFIIAHLKNTIRPNKDGIAIEKGSLIGEVAESSINGGWYPHVHFQCIEGSLGYKHEKDVTWNEVDGYSCWYDRIDKDFPCLTQVFADIV